MDYSEEYKRGYIAAVNELQFKNVDAAEMIEALGSLSKLKRRSILRKLKKKFPWDF